MQEYRLDTVSGFINPLWFNHNRHRSIDAVVDADGTLMADGQRLRFVGETLPAGTQVRISIDLWLTCLTLDDALSKESERRLAVAREEAARLARLNQLRAEAEAFNRRIQLPIEWVIGIKDVLSGLSSRSNGDGRNRATVEHILLQEDLKVGRLHRKAGDFLCTQPSGNNGKQYATQPAEHRHDGEGQPFRPKVTCRKCLALAKPWLLADDVDQQP